MCNEHVFCVDLLDFPKTQTFSLNPSCSCQSVIAVAGVPFHLTLQEVEHQLQPIIRNMLWAVASQKAGLAVEKEIHAANLLCDDKEDPTTLIGYQRYALFHNRLVKMHDELLNSLPFPSVEAFETDLSSRDPVVRLTSAVSKALIQEMERIETLLYQARISRRLLDKKKRIG
jgi:hypothetical protein